MRKLLRMRTSTPVLALERVSYLADDTPIEMSSLVRGVARELRKLGRLVTREAFGTWFETAARATGGFV